MININGKKIKETLTKGCVLVALTGSLIAKNPIKFNNDVNIVYASTNINQTKKDALKELKSVYKTYNKKYYTSKNYNKLTKYYNEAIKLVKESTTVNNIDVVCEKYEELMKSIKPTILTKYQSKMEKKLLKTYKKLITKNDYSESNLEIIEDLKQQGVEQINSSLSKTKAKKAKNNFITKLNNVKTLIQQVKEDAINYINNNKNIDEENKKVLIEQINNNDKEENITAILEEYGYTYEEPYVETNPNKLTLEILNDKDELNKLIENWESNYEGQLWYHTISGEMAYFGDCKHEFMIYLINYQYVDPKKTANEYEQYVNDLMKYYKDDYLEKYDVETLIDELYGLIDVNIRFNKNMDFDSLIIEDNSTKGIGKIINKMIQSVNKKDYDTFKSLLSKYYEKYSNKSISCDAIVYKILKSQYFIDDEYKKENQSKIDVISDNKTKFSDVKKEYFLKESLYDKSDIKNLSKK